FDVPSDVVLQFRFAESFDNHLFILEVADSHIGSCGDFTIVDEYGVINSRRFHLLNYILQIADTATLLPKNGHNLVNPSLALFAPCPVTSSASGSPTVLTTTFRISFGVLSPTQSINDWKSIK